MKSKTGYQMMHEGIGDDEPITEAERMLVAVLRDIREAEQDADYAHELNAWEALRGDVALLKRGELRDVDGIPRVEAARIATEFIERFKREAKGENTKQ